MAQFNWAQARFPLSDPQMADFVDNLDVLNRLGDESPGCVWRHRDDTGTSVNTRFGEGDDVLVNFTVWTSVEALWEYTYKSGHVDFLRRRREWFHAPPDNEPISVMWWIPAGTPPTLDDARQRLDLLAERGEPTVDAFTFRKRFGPPDQPGLED